MRVSTMIRISPRAHPDSGLIDRITDFGRQVEARGFPGVWVGDSVGRGRPTLDSLQVLTALAALTRRVALGIPAEIAAQIARLRSPTADGALPSLRWKVE
jgi:alkanesulfonate monooxygenase SsuD/methylene tetrahydromethanopterin reductase-like flavin-dependent oxidoreductase (luciferase family)